MPDESAPPRPIRTATVDLKVAGSRLRLELGVPDGPVRAIEILPLFQALTDAIVGAAAEDAQRKGHAISCRKGCGACCRQLVPIAEVEVRALRALVASLPEPRRSTIVARFAAARQRLEDAGLLAALRHPERVPSADAEALGNAYFALGIACPFLEDEACSIHAERPLACREYLVTTPAVHCAQPNAENIHCVPVPARVSRAIRRVDEDAPRDYEPWIPMILALEWPLEEEAPRRSGTAMVAKAFAFLTGKEVAEPAPGATA